VNKIPIHITVGLIAWGLGLLLWFAYFTFDHYFDETFRPFFLVVIISLQGFTLFSVGYELKLRYDAWLEKKKAERYNRKISKR